MTPSTPFPSFGKPMRQELFLFADGYIPLNNGSYGTYPRPVHTAKLAWQELAEQRPDYFMRKTYMHQLNKCRAIAAKAINAEAKDCVFVMNATTGVNEVLQSLQWEVGDSILCYSTAYGMAVPTKSILADFIRRGV
jgi:hercynylcysteine S-oxide lyase